MSVTVHHTDTNSHRLNPWLVQMRCSWDVYGDLRQISSAHYIFTVSWLHAGWKSTTSSGARLNKSCTLNNVLTSMNLHVYVLNLLPPLSLKNQLCSGSCSVSADRNGISVIFYHARKHSFLCCSTHHPALPCLHFSVCLFISFLLKWGFRPNHGISMISHAFNLRKQFCACVCCFVVLFLGNLRIWVSHGVQKKLNLPGL